MEARRATLEEIRYRDVCKKELHGYEAEAWRHELETIRDYATRSRAELE